MDLFVIHSETFVLHGCLVVSFSYKIYNSINKNNDGARPDVAANVLNAKNPYQCVNFQILIMGFTNLSYIINVKINIFVREFLF